MKTYPAIAILEFKHIATGIYVTDAMVKQSPISILKAGTVHNGKFLIMVGGSVASVEEAYHKGRSLFPEELIDHVILPDVHPDLHDGILGKTGEAGAEAIGIIETQTVSCAVQSTDRALKETDVDLAVIRLADDLGGKAFSIFSGDLYEVEAAVEAAKQNATH
ncbi:BMC domain-containing protein, partial [Candidatus Parcubacteria bacterium]